MAFEPLMQLAATLGYKGISMRASQASIDTPAAPVAAMKQLLDDLGLVVSMVYGHGEPCRDDDQATAPLRDITPHLDLAERFGCDLVRVMIKEADDIPGPGAPRTSLMSGGCVSWHQDPHPYPLRNGRRDAGRGESGEPPELRRDLRAVQPRDLR